MHPNCRWILLILSAVMVAGCDFDSFVPTAEVLRNPQSASHAFVIDEENIRGIYGNMDVDSTIYQYTTREADADRFWEKLATRAAEAKWQLVHEAGDVRHYDRIIPAVGQQIFHSAEQVRIGYAAATRTVTVAWVQADVRAGSAPPEVFPEADSEGKFARRFVWPNFDELVGQARPSTKSGAP